VTGLQYLSRLAEKMDQAKMLRITVEESECAETFKLEGKIVGPWVEELSRAWHALAPSLGQAIEARPAQRSIRRWQRKATLA
jgi:hypothetical protein